MEIFVIIVAGGSGTRMQSKVPKQFIELCGKPVVMHTVEKFRKALPHSKMILVIPKAHFELWNTLCIKHNFLSEHTVTEGGETRYQSVKNGLALVNGKGIVAIHDAVRPLVNEKVIRESINSAKKYGSGIPVVNLKDSIRRLTSHNSIAEDRNLFKAVQTPQCFSSDIIKKAYLLEYRQEFTDDASVVEAMGNDVRLTEGNDENIKITCPLDLLIAEAIIKSKRS